MLKGNHSKLTSLCFDNMIVSHKETLKVMFTNRFESLIELSLSGMQIVDEQISWMSLGFGKSIKVLTLSHNQLTFEGALPLS